MTNAAKVCIGTLCLVPIIVGACDGIDHTTSPIEPQLHHGSGASEYGNDFDDGVLVGDGSDDAIADVDPGLSCDAVYKVHYRVWMKATTDPEGPPTTLTVNTYIDTRPDSTSGWTQRASRLYQVTAVPGEGWKIREWAHEQVQISVSSFTGDVRLRFTRNNGGTAGSVVEINPFIYPTWPDHGVTYC
jgi:hypothetical protein